MTTDVRSALRRECPIGSLADDLTDAECAELTAWIKEAKSQRRKQIDDSIGEMLNHLPRLVRMPARKILFD